MIDTSTLGYPAESLNDVPAGDYWVQGVFNIYETFHLGNGHTLKLPPDKGEGQHWQVKPGNLYSKPEKMHLDPKSGQTVRISLTEKIPSVEDDPESCRLDRGMGRRQRRARHRRQQVGQARPHPERTADQVLGTSNLSWRRDLAARWMGRASRRALSGHRRAGSFSSRPPGIIAFRTQPPSDGLEGGELRTAKTATSLYQDWTAGRLPRVIVLSIQHATPYFDDSYAVNSENVGPYGDAITQELIPYVEKQFRGIGQGWARSVYGGSTGGWESLASQVFYPDFYNGAWVFCPDVVDFRAYMTMNLYDDKNAFWIATRSIVEAGSPVEERGRLGDPEALLAVLFDQRQVVEVDDAIDPRPAQHPTAPIARHDRSDARGAGEERSVARDDKTGVRHYEVRLRRLGPALGPAVSLRSPFYRHCRDRISNRICRVKRAAMRGVAVWHHPGSTSDQKRTTICVHPIDAGRAA